MADGFLGGLARRAFEARDAAEDYGRDAGRRARGAANDYADDARDYADRARRRARGRAEDARSELRSLWGQMEDLIERNTGYTPREAARAAGGYARTARDYAEDYARDGREYAYEVADQIRSVTRERPLVAIGVAVAATLIITSLLSSGRRR